jgi:hypothetical protein
MYLPLVIVMSLMTTRSNFSGFARQTNRCRLTYLKEPSENLAHRSRQLLGYLNIGFRA